MNWYKKAKETNHDYSWVYVDLPKEIQNMVIEFGKEIDDDDLYKKEADSGRETEPHITIKYALLTDLFKDIKDRLDGEKGGEFYLGKSTIFETDKYDVVKIDVESEDLKRLHDRLNELPHEDKYPDYHAHVTIAYLKKGRGKKYIGKFKIDKKIKFKEIFFGDRERKDHKIKLGYIFNNYKTALTNSVDKEWIDTLDSLQQSKNEGRGISCVQTFIFYLRRNDIQKALAVFNNESDKIRSYEDIDQMIKKKFGIEDFYDKWKKGHR